jgi:hypothetical protein
MMCKITVFYDGFIGVLVRLACSMAFGFKTNELEFIGKRRLGREVHIDSKLAIESE